MKKIRSTIVNWAPSWLYYTIANLRCRISGKAHRILAPRMELENIHLVTAGSESIYICRRGRHNRYKRGIDTLINSLAKQYSLDRLNHLRGGTFIDCGANVGELGLWARNHNHTYFAFEPEQLESRCCDLNNFDGVNQTCRKPLWNKDGTLRLFHRAETADTSLIENGNDTNYTDVEAVMLDTALNKVQMQGPIIFKVEAEGAEPEVLSGASNLLKLIDYVALDCGYERGKNSEHTFVETNKILSNAGFELVSAHFKRVTALYRRKSSAY